MRALASLADALSSADAMRRPATRGATGPERLPPDVAAAAAAATVADDDDFTDAEIERRGGADLVGEPRCALGGGADVSRDAARIIDTVAPVAALAAVPAAAAAPSRVRDADVPTTTAAAAAAAPSRARGAVGAARLRELAECTGATVIRGYRGGGSAGAGEAVERVAFLAAMARAQLEGRARGEGRRRRRKSHLLVGADVVAELAAAGGFGDDAAAEATAE